MRLCNFLITFVTLASGQKLYSGDKVFRLFPATQQHIKLIDDLFSTTQDHSGETSIEFWAEPKGPGHPADLYVRHDRINQVTGFFDLANIAYKAIIDDVQGLIDKVDEANLKHRVKRDELVATIDDAPNIVRRFASYADITRWLEAMCVTFPRLTECGTLGSSFEGRDLRYIKIGFGQSPTGNVQERRSIFIEGGMHAREWLAPATLVYLIDKLVKGYDNDSEIRQLLDNFEIYVIPTANPDGYEYSRSRERLWRKTRSNTTTVPICYGVDGNRNFEIRWATTGSDSNPCSNVYHGPKPFSEPETKAISDFVMSRQQQWLAFISIHAYSQYWLLPYGFESGARPKDYEELERVANIGGSALMAKNGGTRIWEVGNTVNLTYQCSGSSDDWAKAVAGIKYTYTLELSPGAASLTGFIVGESEIEPSGEEVFAGLMAAFNAMEVHTEENKADDIPFMSAEMADVFNAIHGNNQAASDDDEYTFSINELQMIMNSLAGDVKSLIQRVNHLEATCNTEGQALRDRQDKVETQLPKVEKRLNALDWHSDVLWKAVAATQSRQMTIQRQLMDDTLVAVVTPRFLPHAFNKESMLGELGKLNETIEENILDAVRRLEIEEVSEIKPKQIKARTGSSFNSTADVPKEYLIETRRLRSQQRNILLSHKTRSVTEKAGFWFEPQYSNEERLARRSLEGQLQKLKTKYGDTLKWNMKTLKLTTNHGDFYYDTVAKKVYPAGTGRGSTAAGSPNDI